MLSDHNQLQRKVYSSGVHLFQTIYFSLVGIFSWNEERSVCILGHAPLQITGLFLVGWAWWQWFSGMGISIPCQCPGFLISVVLEARWKSDLSSTDLLTPRTSSCLPLELQCPGSGRNLRNQNTFECWWKYAQEDSQDRKGGHIWGRTELWVPKTNPNKHFHIKLKSLRVYLMTFYNVRHSNSLIIQSLWAILHCHKVKVNKYSAWWDINPEKLASRINNEIWFTCILSVPIM